MTLTEAETGGRGDMSSVFEAETTMTPAPGLTLEVPANDVLFFVATD